jgi:hypothetical protein
MILTTTLCFVFVLDGFAALQKNVLSMEGMRDVPAAYLHPL